MKETSFSRERVCNRATGNSGQLCQNFPENQILSLLWRLGNQEQARTAVDHFASSVVSTRRHLVGLVEAKVVKPEPISYRIKMTNGTGNFRNFQISRKKDNLERLTEIFEIIFRKFSVPFDF